MKVSLFKYMSRFHLDDPNHHAKKKLLNEPTNNVESGFYNLDPFYLERHGS
jgi:hypothetical protein